jgi:uncharacterized membrane protein
MVHWERLDLNSDDSLQFSVMYTMPTVLSSFLIVILTVIVIIVMVSLVVYIKSGRKPEEIVSSVLNKDEKILIDLLNKYGGNVVQKTLVRETDFSKAKVSRLVKGLRERGVIKIEPVSGRENRVILKKPE